MYKEKVLTVTNLKIVGELFKDASKISAVRSENKLLRDLRFFINQIRTNLECNLYLKFICF